MAGLTDMAGGASSEMSKLIERARKAWEISMLRQVDSLRDTVRRDNPTALANRCGGTYLDKVIQLSYWDRKVGISWPGLQAVYLPNEKPCSTFDSAMLLYYLHTADGSPMADRWIGFRELPDGAFYHQAFQGYSGNRVAQAFGDRPDAYHQAARALNGWPLPALAEHAYTFSPLPRLRLAAVLWPGDEDFPAKASILFDAAASHFMTTDGLALLGSGLASRLIKRS